MEESIISYNEEEIINKMEEMEEEMEQMQDEIEALQKGNKEKDEKIKELKSYVTRLKESLRYTERKYQNIDNESAEYMIKCNKEKNEMSEKIKRLKASNRVLLFFCAYLEFVLGSKNIFVINDVLSFGKKLIWIIKKYIYIYGFAVNVILIKSGITLIIMVLIYLMLRKYMEYIDDSDIRLFDGTFAYYLFFTFSSLLFASKEIKAVVNINIFELFLLFIVVYVIVRSVVKEHR